MIRRLRAVPALLALLTAASALAACSAAGADEGTKAAGPNGYVSGDGGITQVAPAQRVSAPVVSGPAVSGTGTVSTAHPGKVVVVNVWGSWCNPCRAEAAALQKASRATGPVAAFVGINTRDPDRAPAQAFVRALSVTYPSIYDPEARQLVRFAGQLSPTALPSTLIIDRSGRIAVRISGPISERTLVALVDEVAG